MSIAHHLMEKSKSVEGVLQWPYRSVGIAMEVNTRSVKCKPPCLTPCQGNSSGTRSKLRRQDCSSDHGSQGGFNSYLL